MTVGFSLVAMRRRIPTAAPGGGMTTLTMLMLLPLLDGAEDARQSLFLPGLRAVGDLELVGSDLLHVGMILTNLRGAPRTLPSTLFAEKNITVEFQMVNNKTTKLLAEFRTMFQSIFVHSTGTPLHFIFLTDEESMEIIRELLTITFK